jgi:hypothetical protein
MATSGTTSFNLDIDDVIEEAYERCGIRNTKGYDLKSSRRSLNLLFSEWGNRGIHLWKVELKSQSLTAGQATYTTPSDCSDVLEAYVSSTGAADTTLATALTVGATSVVLTDASTFSSSGTIQIEEETITYSGKSSNTLTGASRGQFGSTAAAHASGTVVQNSSGAVTTSTNDISLTKIDRSAYAGLPNKGQTGQPSQYYVDRQTRPTISLYLTPDANTYTFLKYYYIQRIQDAGSYTNQTDLPYRFLPCMVSGLAFYLSQKYAAERVQPLKLLYEDELERALQEDGQRTSLYISPFTYFGSIN